VPPLRQHSHDNATPRYVSLNSCFLTIAIFPSPARLNEFPRVDAFLCQLARRAAMHCPADTRRRTFMAPRHWMVWPQNPMQKCIGGIGLRYSFDVLPAAGRTAWFRIHAASIDTAIASTSNQQAQVVLNRKHEGQWRQGHRPQCTACESDSSYPKRQGNSFSGPLNTRKEDSSAEVLFIGTG